MVTPGAPPADYVDDLIDGQRRAAEGLLDASEDDGALVAVAEDLAATLHRVVGAERLWSDLEAGSAKDLDRRLISQLVMVDWESLLDQTGVPGGEELTLELTNAVVEASGEQGSWAEVRELLARLAQVLAADAAEADPSKEKRWWKAVRERVAFGVSALGRVKIAALLVGAGKELSKEGVPALTGLVIAGVALGPAAPFVAAAVGGLALSTAAELRRAFREERAERGNRELDRLFDDRALAPECFGRNRADFDLLEIIAAGEQSGSGGAEVAFDLLVVLRSWAARVGARLAAAWPFVGLQIGRAGARTLESASFDLARMRAALLAIYKGLEEGAADAVERAIASAREAFDRTEGTLRALEYQLVGDGYGHCAL